MPCVYPVPAARDSASGRMALSSVSVRDLVDREGELSPSLFLLPCGTCVGCQISRAREWAIRCELEQQLHLVCSFVTLTYSDRYVPPTLSRDHLSRFVRYMRRYVGPFRFFGCGEYGDYTHRPHYHAILYGTADREAAQRAWGKGFVTLEGVTPGRIAYTAGYCAKKLGWSRDREERVDYSTGEVYRHQPPFLQMSRRPGIGGDFRKHWRSWRKSAIWQRREFPVPRFLHESYKENASESELAELELEKLESRMMPTIYELASSEAIARARTRLRSERSKL